MKNYSCPPELSTLLNDYHLQTIFPVESLPHLQLVTYRTGQVICQQGQIQTVLPYLIEGELTISHSLENGVDTILQTQREPGLIGEIELILNRVCISSVVATKPTTVVQLAVAPWRERLLSDPTFLLHTSQTLAEKLHYINHSTPTHLHYTVKERLATHLLQQETYSPIFPLSLTALSSRYGVSYRHLSRVVKELIDEGLIARDKRRYQILDPKGLSRYQIQN
ncbi:Crp/Fnr family transcriptional regulator [Streptococcus sp. DD13]|uniref:Crp/Fnr family transcriptional regulator n=1 Tax=Streptococcus sp. DD13 TaxID=1777881 RepID=UPI000798FD4E|nr:helix-turn-helix domain-containing protein [Streptococcus sp. DD13]KXT77573.1 putative N-ribosylNicotinamide CRP-like regulator [Streptococcus sp. DD13]